VEILVACEVVNQLAGTPDEHGILEALLGFFVRSQMFVFEIRRSQKSQQRVAEQKRVAVIEPLL